MHDYLVRLFLLATILMLASCAQGPESGVDLANFDHAVGAGDDFYRYVNGTWLKKTKIPGDKSTYGSFGILADESEKNLRSIIEEAAGKSENPPGSEEQKVGDFYLSFMDTVRIQELGSGPLKPELDLIAAMQSRADVLERMAHLQERGTELPFSFFVNQDLKKSDQYIGYISQSGIGLPDRDYYFKEEEKFRKFREKYVTHVEKMFALAGQADAKAKAERIMEIEAEMAQSHWTRVENRDREKTYNKYEVKKLRELTPAFDWPRFFASAQIENMAAVIVRQPSYFKQFNTIFRLISVDDWKTYLTWKLLDQYASFLSDDFVEADFDMYRRTLSGVEEMRPRWKRAVSTVNRSLGEVVGKIYVTKHFKPAAKTRMVELVENLTKACRKEIEELEWMSEATKTEALAKLAKFNAKIGYPDKWKDYSGLVVKPDDLLGNIIRSSQVEYRRALDKLGKPIDRSEWLMTPQRVNAYYNPPMNEIVFPAAILQPPFFNMAADDAVNYGAIGAVIGHEISHGFDDQGSRSDGDGNLRNWWTEADREEFKARTQRMVEQFDEFTPVDSMHINGRLTLGENIGDLGGLTIAFKAYEMSLAEKPAAVIDGFTGRQRFFLGWAQVWRRLYRDDELRRRVLTDPHSPSEYRVNGILANMPEFYAAFDVAAEDAMRRPEDVRVKIW